MGILILAVLVPLFAASGAYLVWRVLDQDELQTLRDKISRLESRLLELESRDDRAPPTP